MPSVPVLPTSGKVSLDTSQGYRRVQADASAFGGREAQALGAVGQGLDAVAHAADEIDQEQARTEALQADNAYAAALRERLYGPKGYLTQRGENAVNQRAEAEAGIDELAVSTLGNVRNPRARALAQDALQRRAASALGQISEHAANQTRESQLAAIGAAADVASRNAIDAILANDEGHAAESLASANAAVTRLGELNGWGEVLTTQRRQDLADSITHNVVVELASTDPERARAYFEAHPVADPTQRRQTLVAMQAAQRQARDALLDRVHEHIARGERIPDELWNRLPGQDKTQIQDYLRTRARSIAEGQGEPRDRALVSDLIVLAGDESRRREFLARDLQIDRPRIGQAAYAQLRTAQDQVRNSGEAFSATSNTIRSAMGVARLQLRAALGIPLTADGGLAATATDDQEKQFAEFGADLTGLLSRFVDENGRQPNLTEQSAAVQNLLAEHSARGGFMGWGRQTWHSIDTYTPYDQIPAADIQRIVGALRANDEEVSRGNVERYFETERIVARTGRQ